MKLPRYDKVMQNFRIVITNEKHTCQSMWQTANNGHTVLKPNELNFWL